MNKFLIVLSLAVFSLTNALAQSANAQYVNPFIGTGGHGHTFPGAVLPFGMVQLSPDTRADDSWDGCSGYHYNDSIIYGFSHTHLSGTGCSDWADILVMPITGEASMNNKNYASAFSHKNEKAKPGSYEVLLDKSNVKAELTATLRTGIHRYTFPAGSSPKIILDLLHRDKTLMCGLKIIDSVTVSGFRISEAWAKEQYIYFELKFSKPFKKISYAANKQLKATLTAKQQIEGACFEFNLKDKEALVVKVAISPVSDEGALKNMQTEASHWDFDKYKKDAEQTWNKQLEKIKIETDVTEQRTVFYTALYHCFIHPSLNMDVDNQYRGRDNKIQTANGFSYYSVFSLWDTYRALNPLLVILEPKRTADFIKTFLAQYKASGRLPMWELSSNETDCMIGFHSVAMMTDALTKGIKDIDLPLAYEAMKAASNYSAYGIPEFNRKGYLQVDDESESVSKTLEYGYDNWCLAQVARMLGKKEDAMEYSKRSQAYKNIFDVSTGFIRPRKNGGWLNPFYASEINNHFTEGNSWQYSFYVPHDIDGLIRLHGSKENFEKKLDELFTTSEKTRGRDQADVTGLMGQYAHGNEPSHHMAYLYNYVGNPQKTIDRVSRICNEFYKDAPDGLIGNEDCGQMSAWYVFSSMGLYPVCPGSKEYSLAAPLFKSVSIFLDNKDTISIISNARAGFSLSQVKVNARKLSSPVISHNQIAKGCKIEYIYSAKGDTTNSYGKKGFSAAWFRTLSGKMIPSVVINSGARVFKDHTEITLIPINTISVSVYYTFNGSEPTRSAELYSGPFTITDNCTIKVKAYSLSDSSAVTQAQFYKLKNDYPINIVSEVNPQYAADGSQSLMDGINGSLDWRKGEWIGCQAQDFECIVDLKETKEISALWMNCLQDTRSWIVLPKQVSFFSSDDGKNFNFIGQINSDVKPDNYTIQTKRYEWSSGKKVNIRYIKIVAQNFGKLPEWHIGKGGEAFIFTDELEVK